MSKEYVSFVLGDPYHTQADKSRLLVAVVLAEFTNEQSGVCWPSLETIAKRARTSVRGAQAALRQLQEDGKLNVEANRGPMGANLYRLTVQAVAPPPPATNGVTPATVRTPPATERHSVSPKPEGTIPTNEPTGYPDENSFVSFFLPSFVNYPDFPAADYLRHRYSDFDSTGWLKGQRAIVNWRSLGGSLQRDYRQDRMERQQGSNPNAPRNGRRAPAAAPKPRSFENDPK